jgi:Zn-dependent peptidase ImmA (M78 family)
MNRTGSSDKQSVLGNLAKIDPVRAVRLRANNLISGLDGPPFELDCDAIRAAANIGEIRRTPQLSALGRIFWNEANYVIELKNTSSPGQLAFTLGHEIGHTFFMKPGEERAPRRSDSVTESFAVDKREEYLCDVAAAEMLMPAGALITGVGSYSSSESSGPANSFLNRVSRCGPSARSVLALANEFGTSLTATARRFAEMGLWSCHVGLWKAKSKGTPEFSSGFVSGRSKLNVPKGYSAPERSVVAAASIRGHCVEGRSNIGLVSNIGEPYGPAYTQAMPLGEKFVLSVSVFERTPEILVATYEKSSARPTKQTEFRFHGTLPRPE